MVEFGREFYKKYNYKVDCHYLIRAHYLVLIVFVYFMKLQMKFCDSPSFHGFRFKSAIPRSRKITGPSGASRSRACQSNTLTSNHAARRDTSMRTSGTPPGTFLREAHVMVPSKEFSVWVVV